MPDADSIYETDFFIQWFETSPDAMFLLKDQKLVVCNQSLVRLLGYTDKQLIPPSFLQNIVIGHFDRQALTTSDNMPLGDGLVIDCAFQRADGSSFLGEISLTPLRLNRKLLLHGVIRDISRYQATENALHENQRILSAILSNIVGMAYRCRYSDYRHMEFVSEGCRELTGYSVVQFLQEKPVQFDDLIEPSDQERVREEIHAAILEDRPFKISYRIKTVAGQEKWVVENGRAFHALHDILYLEGIVVDITERILSYQLLEQRVEKRTQQFFTLFEVSRDVASTLNKDTLLDLILEQLGKVVEYQDAIIWEYQAQKLTLVAYRSHSPNITYTAEQLAPIGETRVSGEVLASYTPIIVPDLQGGSPLAIDFRHTIENSMPLYTEQNRCWMGLRLNVYDRVIGMLSIGHQHPNSYTIQQAQLTQAFANYAAIAMENAHLYAQAQELAALNERQRLAQEFHDSVSQTLFSTKLIAEVLPDILKHNPTVALERIRELRDLTSGALAEMRTLLLELRPKTLIESDLSELVRHLVEATIGKARIPVEYDTRGKGTLPPLVQIAIYRITQEALNNIVRHAKATQAAVTLHYQKNAVYLKIRDDGVGFNPDNIPPSHLGISFMQERAASIKAKWHLETAVGEGTEISVHWEQTN